MPSEDPFAPYQGLEHNDAFVLGCRLERTSFSLTLNHYNVWRLAATLARDDDSWHRLRDRFPVTLQFENVREFYVVQQRAIGDYRLLRLSLDGLSEMLGDVISLRCVGMDEGNPRFALDFHGRRSLRTKQETANEISVLLRCGRVTVSETLRKNWVDSIGVETLPLLEALFEAGPVQGWAVPDFQRFVAAHESTEGL